MSAPNEERRVRCFLCALRTRCAQMQMCGKKADAAKWATKTTARCLVKILWLNSGYCTRYLQTPPPPHYSITATRWGAAVPRGGTTIYALLLLLLYLLLWLLTMKRSIAEMTVVLGLRLHCNTLYVEGNGAHAQPLQGTEKQKKKNVNRNIYITRKRMRISTKIRAMLTRHRRNCACN